MKIPFRFFRSFVLAAAIVIIGTWINTKSHGASVSIQRLDPETGKNVEKTYKLKRNQTAVFRPGDLDTLKTPPSWLVKVTQCKSDDRSSCVSGAGTLVRVDGALAVLTDYHLTFLQTIDLSIQIKTRSDRVVDKKLSVLNRKSWPTSDLALIFVKAPKDLEGEILYLAEFQPDSKRFVVRGDLSQRYSAIASLESSTVEIQGGAAWGSYLRNADWNDVIPRPRTEQTGLWEKKQSLSSLSKGVQKPQLTRAGDYIVHVRLGPGASGVPLIGREKGRYFIRGIFQRSSLDFERSYFLSDRSIGNLLTSDSIENQSVQWVWEQGLIYPIFPGKKSEIFINESPAGGAEANGGGAEANGGGGEVNGGKGQSVFGFLPLLQPVLSAWTSLNAFMHKYLIRDSFQWGSSEAIGLSHREQLSGKPLYGDGFSLRELHRVGALESAQPIEPLVSLTHLLSLRSGIIASPTTAEISSAQVSGTCQESSGCKIQIRLSDSEEITFHIQNFQSLIQVQSQNSDINYQIDLRDLFFIYLGVPDNALPTIRVRRLEQELDPYDTEWVFPVQIR